MDEINVKDEIIIAVKEAISANTTLAAVDWEPAQLYSDDVDNIAEMVAENLYNAGYRKTFTSEFASDTQKAFKEGYQKGKEDSTAESDTTLRYAIGKFLSCSVCPFSRTCQSDDIRGTKECIDQVCSRLKYDVKDNKARANAGGTKMKDVDIIQCLNSLFVKAGKARTFEEENALNEAKDKIRGYPAEIARLTAENDELKEKWNNLRCVHSYDGEVMEYCVNGPCPDMKTIDDVRKETAKNILYEVSLHCDGDWLISLFQKYGIQGDTQ